MSPNWESIKSKLINKYGKPTKIQNNRYAKHNVKGLCWGDCTRDNLELITNSSSSLSIHLWDQTYKDTGERKIKLQFKSSDPILYERNSNWISQQRNQISQQKKDRESNIDF